MYGLEIQSDKSVPGVQGARLIRQSVRGLQATTAHTHLTCTWNKPIKYLLDDLHQILQNLPTLADILVCNDGCGQVTQDVGAHGLDRVEVSGWGKDKGNYFIALIKGAISFGMTRNATFQMPVWLLAFGTEPRQINVPDESRTSGRETRR